MATKRDPFSDNWQHLATLPDYVLFDIARNESAQRDYRLKAVEHLYVRKSPKVKHEDLRHLVHELKIELAGIEFDHPAPSGPGPLVASITTESMWGPTAEEIERMARSVEKAIEYDNSEVVTDPAKDNKEIVVPKAVHESEPEEPST